MLRKRSLSLYIYIYRYSCMYVCVTGRGKSQENIRIAFWTLAFFQARTWIDTRKRFGNAAFQDTKPLAERSSVCSGAPLHFPRAVQQEGQAQALCSLSLSLRPVVKSWVALKGWWNMTWLPIIYYSLFKAQLTEALCLSAGLSDGFLIFRIFFFIVPLSQLKCRFCSLKCPFSEKEEKNMRAVP